MPAATVPSNPLDVLYKREDELLIYLRLAARSEAA